MQLHSSTALETKTSLYTVYHTTCHNYSKPTQWANMSCSQLRQRPRRAFLKLLRVKRHMRWNQQTAHNILISYQPSQNVVIWSCVMTETEIRCLSSILWSSIWEFDMTKKKKKKRHWYICQILQMCRYHPPLDGDRETHWNLMWPSSLCSHVQSVLELTCF